MSADGQMRASEHRWGARNFALSPGAFGVVFGLALALRAGHLGWLASRHPELVDRPVLDALHYHRWALDLLDDRGLARELIFMHPTYPYALALLYSVTGPHPIAAAIAQCFLGALSSCALAALVARRFESRQTGLVAGLGLAVYGPLVVGDSLLETTAVSIALLLGALLLVDTLRPQKLIAAGALFALAALARGNLLVCLPAVLALVLFTPRIERAARARLVAAFFAGMLVVHVGLGARNYAVTGTFAMSTSNLGPTLYLSHHPSATTGGQEPPAFVRPDPRFELDDWRREAARDLGRVPTITENDRYWRRRTWAAIAADPGHEALLFARKIGLAFGAAELADNYSLSYLASLTPVGVLPLLGFSVALGFGVVGAFVRLRDYRKMAPFYGFCALYPLSLGLLYVSSRFRVPMAPFVVAFAAAGVIAVWEWARARQTSRLLAALVATSAVVMLSRLATAGAPPPLERAQALNSHGLLLLEAGRPRDARALLAESARLDEKRLATWLNLALANAQIPDFRGALEAARRAEALDPSSAEAASQEGVALTELGDEVGAEAALRRAVALAPEAVEPRLNLATWLGQRHRLVDAKGELEAVLARAPRHEGARFRHALCELELDPPKGRAELASLAASTRDPELLALLRPMLDAPRESR